MGEIHFISWLSLVSGLANVALAAFVMGKDSSSRVNRSLAWLALCFAAWSIGEFFMRTAGSTAMAVLWVRLEALGYVGVGSVYLVFSLLYSDQRWLLKKKWFRAAVIVPPFIFLGLIWLTSTVYPDIEVHEWGNRPEVGLAFYPLVIYIALEWVAGGMVFWRRVKTLETEHERRATIYLLIGTVLPIIVATITAGVFPILGVDVPEMATLISIFNAVILVYIIQRYQVLTFVPSRFADTLVASTGDAIIASDRDGIVIYFSPGAERMFGYRADEVIDQPVARLFLHADDEWHNLSYLLRQEESVRNYQTEMITGDQQTLTASLTLSYLLDDTDNRVGTVSVIHDITEMVRLQNQLMKTQRLESLGSLASGITHDFNNILSIILPWTQMLKLKRADDRLVVEHAERIEKAATSASDLVQRLLTFARGSTRQPVVLNPNRLIEDTVELLERTLPQSVSIVTNLRPDLPDVEADYLQFEQALMNLILNGVDAMPGGGTITISVRRLLTEIETSRKDFTLPAGDWVVIAVRDSGQGISVEHLAHIFDPFFTTKPGGKGTGLGLMIVETFVRNHGGYVDVYSHPGVQTTFELILPATSKRVSEEVPYGGDPRKGRGERILVIDRNPEIRETLTQLLSELNYDAHGSKDFAHSLAELVQAKTERTSPVPDLLIVEIEELPGDGRESFELLNRVIPRARILLTSAGVLPDRSLIGLHTGILGVLYKPFDLDEVMRAVRDTLDGREFTPARGGTSAARPTPRRTESARFDEYDQ
jgi:PAS domain S-box-containing protein